jgi:hypothetical protein
VLAWVLKAREAELALRTMTQDEVLRALRTIRYSPKRGRRVGLTFIARQAGYAPETLFRVALRGWCSRQMAERLSAILQNMTLFGGHTACSSSPILSSLGPYGGGIDPRGGPHPAHRPDDRRLRSARASGGTSEANASLGPHGGRTENALSRGPYGGGTAQSGPRRAGRRSKQTPAVTDELNAEKQAPTQGPTNPVIRIDVGRLLKKQLR